MVLPSLSLVPSIDKEVGYIPVDPRDITGLSINAIKELTVFTRAKIDDSSSSGSEDSPSACCGPLIEGKGRATLHDSEDACCKEISESPRDVLLISENGTNFCDGSKAKMGAARRHLALGILLLANLLNYMDRYTIAGVLVEIQAYYRIGDAQAGLLQTAFIVFYMVFSLLFGYLGDRFNRKVLMAVGIFIWSMITLASSFIPSHLFWLFVFMRAMVGLGEASYSTIAPTIIADLYTADKRTNALSIFYFAIPVGSGLGYIVGSEVAKALGSWQWALRVTPVLGLICGILILVVIREPERGAADGGHNLHASMSLQSWGQDIVYLVKNKSFMLSTFGFTCVAFVSGALAFWAPTFMVNALKVQNPEGGVQPSLVSLKFGVITCVAGLLGVITGSQTSKILRRKHKNADPLVCAFGLLMSAPFLFAVLVLAGVNEHATWVCIFLGETFLCLNWAVVTDILLYVVIPTRRSTAEAVQMLIGHLFGDAGSPYLLGLISSAISDDSMYVPTKFYSLQTAMYMMAFVSVLGGGFFLFNALFVQEDKLKADTYVKSAGKLAHCEIVTDVSTDISA